MGQEYKNVRWCVLEFRDFSGDYSLVEDMGCSVTVINVWTPWSFSPYRQALNTPALAYVYLTCS